MSEPKGVRGMRRIGFTLAYECLHHLQNDDYAMALANRFDQWVIVEGAANNGGSTDWCKEHPGEAHSTDGTLEYLYLLQNQYPNVKVITQPENTYWNSKDDMVNAAMQYLRETRRHDDEYCLLWQIDADEVWELPVMEQNEERVVYNFRKHCSNTGTIAWKQVLGEGLSAIGEWGGGYVQRIWYWHGELFESHEPSRLSNERNQMMLPGKCVHNSYLFEKDVLFKSKYYGGHENVHKNWLKLQSEKDTLTFPLPIAYLFGNDSWWSKKNSFIVKD